MSAYSRRSPDNRPASERLFVDSSNARGEGYVCYIEGMNREEKMWCEAHKLDIEWWGPGAKAKVGKTLRLLLTEGPPSERPDTGS